MLRRSAALWRMNAGVSSLTMARQEAEAPVYRENPRDRWKVGMEAEMRTLEGSVLVVVTQENVDGSVMVQPLDTTKQHRVENPDWLHRKKTFFERWPPKQCAIATAKGFIWLGSIAAPGLFFIYYMLTWDHIEFVPWDMRNLAEKDDEYDAPIADELRRDMLDAMKR